MGRVVAAAGARALKRISFLSLFFFALTIVFAGAVWLRLRAYDTVELREAGIGGAPVPGGRQGRTAVPAAAAGSVAETGTIVEIADRQPSTPSLSAREQRYQELLREPAPVPPAAPEPADKSTFLQRVVSPITNALGITKAKPAQSAAPAPVRPVAPRESSGASGGTKTDTTETGATQPEADPETDIIPPQLLTAEFVPQQVQDGEETVFTAVANDNLSGIRSVSGVIASPSGSLQGFAATREGETNRFAAKVSIPRDAPEGVWIVKYVMLTDNAGNTINLNSAQGALPGTASFRVVSATGDGKGPQLKAVWIDRPAMRAGEKNTVFVQAEDDKAGVSLVNGVFVSPSKSARVGFGCRAGAGDAWECTVTPPACLDCGVWRLEQIQLQDKANNLTTFRADNPLVGSIVLDITGDRCDSAAPIVTQLTIDPPVVSNAQPSVVTVRATVYDEGGCGTSSLSGQAVPPGSVGGQRQYFSFRQSGAPDSFVGEIRIPQFAAKGEWTIAWIQALDKGMNLRAYSAAEPVVARATFRVE